MTSILVQNVTTYNMATYQEILQSLLEMVAENPDSNIDELLTKKAIEYGLSGKEIEQLKLAYAQSGFC